MNGGNFAPRALGRVLCRDTCSLSRCGPECANRLKRKYISTATTLGVSISGLRPFALGSGRMASGALVFDMDDDVTNGKRLALCGNVNGGILDLRLRLRTTSLRSISVAGLSTKCCALICQTGKVRVERGFVGCWS